MTRKTIYFILIFIGINIAYAANWQTLSPGIDYLKLPGKGLAPWSYIHVFRINLSNNKLDLISASEFNRPSATVDEFAHHKPSLITINAGFFDEAFRPIGLRIAEKKQRTPFKTISWWGVFYTCKQKPFIVSAQEFRPNQSINFGIQSGPRLLVNKHIMPLKAGYAERSALGISANGEVIMLVTENSALTTKELALIMQASPINCVDALNLDGGGSSQLYANMANFHKHVRGYSSVSDAIVVVPR